MGKINKERSRNWSKYKVGDKVFWVDPPIEKDKNLVGLIGVVSYLDPERGYGVKFPVEDYRAPFSDEELRPISKLDKVLK